MSTEQILNYTKICSVDPRDTCPIFDRNIGSGVWECKLSGINIIDGWNRSNTECSLQCDGKKSPSIDIKCDGSEYYWMQRDENEAKLKG